MEIAQNLAHIRQQIADCHPTQEVTLLAVSKTKPFADILTAYHAGQRQFGENYVQEGVEKIQLAKQQNINDITWHLIGPLQSNKTRIVAEHFDWVQTIDRVKIAERLSQQRPDHLQPLQVLIQINISDENSKSGITPQQMEELAQQIINLPKLQLRGLMAIPAPTEDINQQTAVFNQMKVLLQQLQQRFPQQKIDTLSMGMTDDMQTAIACGSTMVRIGTAIFGKRNYSV
ncbi:YggS family pyridoxal phosphate-dependent enzyme [Gallibacterium anatis]|uniref:Pyridoxal phosphate homeostasis protein n=1 Tax=Gallibacterium anatis TaxID=750 RepID=A0A921H8Y8_9PAST|nr:YggS family pyridoxal phosphate-dependent enzyme [Gallibacterium anatis]WKS96811.1 YggS family pyridoxal phosphate-dependent enzyme [Gallibacterium anatis]HJF73226.1 YggS family pyridoxal phosphate-dependent enzyme [Gallibacterium anatis]